MSTSFGRDKGGNITSVGWQVTLCDPIWHVSSSSGVATLRTTIHLLLTCYRGLLLVAGAGQRAEDPHAWDTPPVYPHLQPAYCVSDLGISVRIAARSAGCGLLLPTRYTAWSVSVLVTTVSPLNVQDIRPPPSRHLPLAPDHRGVI